MRYFDRRLRPEHLEVRAQQGGLVQDLVRVYRRLSTKVRSFSLTERFSKLAKLDNVTFFLSQYMLELGLLDSKMSQFSQSLQAVAAIYTAKKYLMVHNQTNMDLTTLFSEVGVSYSPDQVKSCAKCFNQLAILIQKSKLQMIVKKFRTSKYLEVARIVSQNATKPKNQSQN